MSLNKKSSSDEMAKIASRVWGMKGLNVKVESAGENISKKASINKEAFGQDFAQTQFYSPRLTQDTWYLPRTRKMLLRWVKIFFQWDPYIYSILNLHARYPISDFQLVCETNKQKEFFDEVLHNENWDILDVMREGSLSLKLYGEAFAFGEFDEKLGIWKSIVWLDPALIEVEEVPFSNKVKIFAEIPKKFKAIMQSGKPIDVEKQKFIPKELKEAITKGQRYIELDTEEGVDDKGNYSPCKVCFLSNKADVGEDGLRGFPPITPLMKDLVYSDYLRKAQMARVQRFAYPIEIWKVGDVAAGYLPNEDDLANVREMLKQALATVPYTIVYSPLISLEVVSAAGGLLNIFDDYNFIENRILIGLGTNKNIVLGEGGWMSNAKTLSMQRLIMDYQVDRDMWTRKFLQNFILRPMCIANGYVKNSPIFKKDIPKIPKISWLKSLDLQNEEDTKKIYIDMWKDGLLSIKTLFAKFPDLDMETEQRNLEKEVGTIFDNEERNLPSVFNKLEGGANTPSKDTAIDEGAGSSPAKPAKPQKMDI